MQETDLFLPLKHFYEKLGYSVEGEVKACDVLAKAGQDFLAIELKQDLNLKVILQAVNRQKLFDVVYIAVPMQKIKPKSQSYLDKLHLLKRLGIGLLLVHTVTGEVLPVQQPVEAERTRIMAAAKKKRAAVIAEFEKRLLKNNTGGAVRKPITTAYREQCYLLAYLLKDGSKTPAELVETGLAPKRAAVILNANFYGWFEKEKRGVYCLSPLGQEVLQTEKEVIAALIKQRSLENGCRL